jgi:hypothetical protein
MLAIANLWRTETGRACLWSGTMIFLTAGYFYNVTPGWNANSQFALTSAIVERRTLSIDAYHDDPAYETGDKAYFDGHYYCDKSPVTPFLGIAPLAVYRAATAALGLERSVSAGRYWTTWWTTGLSAAIIAALTTLLLIQRGASPTAAARFGALWVAATPLLGYATVMFSYTPACAMLLGGYLLVSPAWLENRRLSRRRLAAAGLLMGLAAWTLNTTALITIFVTLGLMICGLGGDPDGNPWRERLRRLWPWTLGGLAGVVGYFAYSYTLFGTFESPYAYEADPGFREQMARGFMGAGPPRLLVALLMTLRPFQGLFVWFPLATAAMIGLVVILVDKEQAKLRTAGLRAEAWMALVAFLGLLTYISGYYMWWGGWSYMPRHLIPALALLPVGLLPWMVAPVPRRRILLLLIGLVGASISVSAVAFNPQHAMGIPQDILEELLVVDRWPSPMLHVLERFWMAGRLENPNWGTMLGIAEARLSLLPLLALWIAGVWIGGRIESPKPDPGNVSKSI